MDTDVATQVRNAFGVSFGGEENTAKNSGRNSYNYKIFIKIVFRRDDVLDPTTIRYRFMGLSDAIVKAANGNSDAVYLATIDGQRIDPQSSPTDPHEFKSQVKWTIEFVVARSQRTLSGGGWPLREKGEGGSDRFLLEEVSSLVVI